jgi:NAD(P)-dependent dehydrogenase (short-subunit alcohol dehydrogenase family)
MVSIVIAAAPQVENLLVNGDRLRRGLWDELVANAISLQDHVAAVSAAVLGVSTMPFDLTDQVILVTGAGRGLGRAAAELLAQYGAIVGIADIDAATPHQVAAGIAERGGLAYPLVGDVGERAVFLKLAADLARRHGRIDGVVNAAMWIRYEPIAQVRDEAFDRMLDVGLKAAVWSSQALLAHRDPHRGAAIVNFSSPAADQGYPDTAIYASVKGAIIALTRTLSVELGRQGVRVNAITPGAVPTPGARAVVDEAGYELRRRKTPLGRLGREEDIANMVAFLFSSEAEFVNGAILHVDGGVSVTAG